MQYSKEKLKKFFCDNEIEVILFDLDDTLIDTNTVFYKRIHEVLDHLSSKLSLNLEALSKKFESELVKAHYIVAVNPQKLWPRIFNNCQREFEWDKEISKEALDMLMELYSVLPEILPGVISTLEVLKENKRYLGLVTHASEGWTNFKLEGLDLSRFFQHVELFDINIHKNVEVWKSAIEAFKVLPKNTLVVGDSVKGDIQAAHEAGVRNLVWVNRKEGWDVYKEGELPEGTIEISGTHELLRKLCESV